MIRPLYVLLFVCGLLACEAQESIRHMHYNLTLYGNPFSCNEGNNNSEEKDAALQEIIAYAQPDIFTVNELNAEEIWADRILNEVMAEQNGSWSRAQLSDEYTWSSIINGCYYRSDRLVLQGQEVVYQDIEGNGLLRPLDLYTFYPILPEVQWGDTTFITVVVAHLAAGSAEDREDQTEAVMAHIAGRGAGNYIFTGDLNMDAATEPAFQYLVSPDEVEIALIDPVSTDEVWHNNSNVAAYHTQSTRYNETNFGCFAGGGLDDRFDMTLLSSSLIEGSEGVQYVEGSYSVVGQSGQNYNQALVTNANGAVPDPIAEALYAMSDHLPVITDYSIDMSVGLHESAGQLHVEVLIRPGYIECKTEFADDYEIALYDVAGRQFGQWDTHSKVYQIPYLNSWNHQVMLLRISSAQGVFLSSSISHSIAG